MAVVIDFVKESFETSITEAVNTIKNEAEKEKENINKCKNDRERVNILTLLFGEAMNIFLTAKRNFEAKLLNALNSNSLSDFSGYNKLLEDAIDCLTKKEILDKSLAAIEEQIEKNNEELKFLDGYYKLHAK